VLQNIHTIVFDFDGVLNRNYDERGFIWSRELHKEFGISGAQLDAALFGAQNFADILVGKVDLHDALEKILKDHGCAHAVEDFATYWFENDLAPCKGMLTLIDDLRARGIPCVIGTNNEPRRAAFLWERLLKNHTDGIYTAGVMGIAKPDVAFFHHIQAALKVEDAMRLLFIDDIAENVAGAKDAGWQALQYGDYARKKLGQPDDLRAALGLPS
jgi:HAD superfamily hydrolase (TIGR01509 family)